MDPLGIENPGKRNYRITSCPELNASSESYCKSNQSLLANFCFIAEVSFYTLRFLPFLLCICV